MNTGASDQATDAAVLRAVDAVAVGTTIATLAGWLPAIAALLTIIWTAIRIWETDTVRRLTRRHPSPLKED